MEARIVRATSTKRRSVTVVDWSDLCMARG
jgi:hypothetical protein